MAGGIQIGNTATSTNSELLDNVVFEVSRAISSATLQFYMEFGHKNLISERYTQSVKEQASLPEFDELGIQLGCMPNGGMWFNGSRAKTRKLVAVFEASYQQDGGNAIERWATNYLLCKAVNPDVKYITFMSGDGAKDGGVLNTYANTMKNILGDNIEFYCAKDGFTHEKVFSIMKTAMGLNIEFDAIKRYLPAQLVDIKTQLNNAKSSANAETMLDEWLKDKTNPITGAWFKLKPIDRPEAKLVAVEYIIEGLEAELIADELLDLYL